ncbi:MAG: diguanylate cyclase, partial [Candidatus Eremiobacteraeota bacterium]|nr:diguanylate cyclase [Candidatus Eremiobacteraeota bacterium]
IGALSESQRTIDDFDFANDQRFARFMATARAVEQDPRNAALQDRLGSEGVALFNEYDRVTNDYAAADGQRRAVVRNVFVGGLGFILVVLGLLYFFVMRSRDRRVVAAFEELEERGRRFTAMFDSSSDMMAVYGIDGTIERFNRSAHDRLGYGPQTLGRQFAASVVAADRDAAARAFADAAAGTAVQLACSLIDARTKGLPVAMSLSPIVVHETVIGVVAAARDVSAERTYERDLLRSREAFSSLFKQSPVAIVSIARDGTISDVNGAMERLSGYSAHELVGESCLMLVPRESATGRIERLMSGKSMTYEAPLYTRRGENVPVEIDASPIVIGDSVEGAYFVIKDQSADLAVRRRLEEKDERVRTLLHLATSPAGTAERIDQALFLGTRTLDMEFGFVVEIHEGELTVIHRFGPEIILPVKSRMQTTRSLGGKLVASARAIAVDDLTIEPYAAELRERNLPWKSYIGAKIEVDGAPYGALVFADRNRRKSPFEPADLDYVDVMTSLVASTLSRGLYEAALRERAGSDSLTGLANRSTLEQSFALMSGHARRSGERLALHYLDLDGFKQINDLYGHDAGDEVLREVARRFQVATRAEDMIARVGGDEFAIVQCRANADAVAVLTNRLHDDFERSIDLPNGLAVRASASHGVVFFPDDGEDLRTLLQAADRAMYRRKRLRVVEE